MAWPKLYHRPRAGPLGFGVGGTMRCRRPSQEAFGAQIFIQIRPVDAVSPARNFPIAKLFLRGVQKPWIPGKRHTDGPSILQLNAERVGSKTHVRYPPIALQPQNTHSMPLSICPDCTPPRILPYRRHTR